MRLISCYIENYGAISGQEFVFERGITEQMLNNGAGKTTLASFLQAMLYGLEGYRSNAVGFCDRQRYYPFQGGLFGGSLTLEHGGKEYKIERTFAEKSESADTLTVYLDGEVTAELGEEIGKKLLGIDKQAFQRTVFIGSEDIEISANSSISAKLNGFLQGVDDAGFERAIEALEKASKVYQKRGKGNDRIAETTAQINDIKEKITNAEKVAEVLEQRYGEEKKLKEELRALNKKLEEAQLANQRLGEWEYYQRLLQIAEEEGKKAMEIQSRYPLGMPKKEDTDEVRRVSETLARIYAQSEKKTFSPSDELRLEEYKRRFFDGVPSETELSGIERTVEELTQLQTKMDFYGERETTDEQRRILQKFSLSRPSEEELIAGDFAAQACVEIRNELSSMPETLVRAEDTAQKAPKRKRYGVVVAVALLLGIIGGFLTTRYPLVGFSILALEALTALAGVFVSLRQKTRAYKAETVQTRNPKRDEKERELRAREDAVRALVLPYGYTLSEGEKVAVYRLRQDLASYDGLQKEKSERENALRVIGAEIASRTKWLKEVFDRYQITAEKPQRALQELREAKREYTALSLRKADAVDADSALEKDLERGRARVGEYLQKYELQELNLLQIEKDYNEYFTARQNETKSLAEAEEYRAEKGLREKPCEEKEDIVVLNEKLQALRKRGAVLAQEISEDEYAVEKLEEYRAELERKRGFLAEYKEKYRLLCAATELLGEADKRLRDKYVQPIKEAFTEIAEPLEMAIGERLLMTKNFEIRYDLHGKARSDRHLSAGQRSLCALCFRLALIKNMYADGLPFLILDDPFVHLDQTHLLRVRVLLNELSKDFQMIYFTCHESRSLIE